MLIVLAPGAGLPSTSPWMLAWAERLGTLGRVVPLDYPYRLAGRSRPDRLPVLVAHHRQIIEEQRRPGERVVLAGKSMGGRVGCHVSLEIEVDGLVCLGYPLAAMGNTAKLRDQVLVDLRTPVLFVQGTRDKLCPLDLLEDVRGRMTARSTLHVVPTGDHSLQVTKTHTKQTGRTQDDEDGAVLAEIAAFVRSM
jgi:predicted alpha/beta-hydrolase family hydrolase